MITKLIGAALICIACAYTGLRKSGDMKGREKALRNISSALGYLETEIGFSSNNLKKAFENIDKYVDTVGLFSDAADKIDSFGIKKSWAYAVMKNAAPITEQDRELLLMLGTKLGMTDTQNQLKHISYIKELVNARSSIAENEYKRLGRIYRGGGILAGLFIVLLVI